jgi:hypothetical protein
VQAFHGHIGPAVHADTVTTLLNPPQRISQPSPLFDVALRFTQIQSTLGFNPGQISVVSHATQHLGVFGRLSQFRCNLTFQQPRPRDHPRTQIRNLMFAQ